jgi:fucose permease
VKPDYRRTVHACFIGYIVQAVVNNFAPLLFLTFQDSYNIPLPKITMLITINFSLQLMTDLLSAGFVDKIGYRASALIAHILSAAGLICLTFLPEVFPDPFIGLLLAVMIYAVGGGLLEVLISPIVQACPTDNKEKTMSLLHSFYCWGYVGVVLCSTLFFNLFGIGNWKILCLIWAFIPIANALVFIKVPIAPLMSDGEKGLTIKELARKKVFWFFMLLMLCAGASEQAVSQWASTFAEQGIGVSKTIGDLMGPMFFAAMMGVTRLIYGKRGDNIDLNRFMIYSSILCVFSYLIISLSRVPAFGLIGCGLCGMSVGILWPGTYSMASSAIKGGGTAMFAFLALAGDLGCSAGPTLVGLVSSAAGNNLKMGILIGTVFPVVLLFSMMRKRKTQKV